MKLPKNEKGITLIVLIITIVILLILAGIGVGISVNGINSSQDAKKVAELTMVQHAILEQYATFQLTKNKTELVGNPLSQEEIKKIASELGIQLVTIPDSYENKEYYRLDKASLLELGFDKTEDEYIVNYVSGEVINMTQKYTSDNKALYVQANRF